MTALAAKLLLAPSLIAVATLVSRHHGHRMGALLATLPAAAGPILLVLALQQGEGFASRAAAAALLGVVGLNAFIVVYCRAAWRMRWPLALPLGWAAYLLTALALEPLDAGPAAALLIALAANVVTLALLPRAGAVGDPTADEASRDTSSATPDAAAPAAAPLAATAGDGDASAGPSYDIPLRATAAVALIVAITALAETLGPKWTGLLTPFPIIATVLAAFTHAQEGAAPAVRMMRAFVTGLFAFATFFFVTALTLEPYGAAAGFALAVGATIAVQLVALAVTADGP